MIASMVKSSWRCLMKKSEVVGGMVMVLMLYLCMCALYSTGIAVGAHEGAYMPFWHWPIKLIIALQKSK